MFKNVDNSRGIPEIDPKEVIENLANIQVVDVRTDEEYELGHISGAELVPMDAFPDALEDLSQDKTIVFVCRSGNRSGRVTHMALENGFKKVYNMSGGMLLWNDLGLETE